MSNDNFWVTLKKEIYIPESNRWSGDRGDVIACREYDTDETEVCLIGTDKGHDIIVVNRDNIAGIVDASDQ